jgi:hypothetical protein
LFWFVNVSQLNRRHTDWLTPRAHLCDQSECTIITWTSHSVAQLQPGCHCEATSFTTRRATWPVCGNGNKIRERKRGRRNIDCKLNKVLPVLN